MFRAARPIANVGRGASLPLHAFCASRLLEGGRRVLGFVVGSDLSAPLRPFAAKA